MAKPDYKNIRMTIPYEVHKELKRKALEANKNFLDWLNDLLKAVATGKVK